MALSRWEPSDGLLSLRDAINRLLEDSFVGMASLSPFSRILPVDIRETDGEYVIEAALPGMRPEDVHVTATRGSITIQASSKTEQKTEKAGTYVRRERYEGELRRTIELPSSIDPDEVTATYEHGMLMLHIHKAEEAKPKSINIQVK